MGICAGRECNFFHTPDSEEQLRIRMLKEYLKYRQADLLRQASLTEEDTISSNQNTPRLPDTSCLDTPHQHINQLHQSSTELQHFQDTTDRKIQERHNYDSLSPDVFTFQTDHSEPHRYNKMYDNKDKNNPCSQVQYKSETESDRSIVDQGYGLQYDILKYTQFPSPLQKPKVEYEESYDKVGRHPLGANEVDELSIKPENKTQSVIYEEIMYITPDDADYTSNQCHSPAEDKFEDNSEIEEETKLPVVSTQQANFDYEEAENMEIIQKLKERRSHHMLRSYERRLSPDLDKLDSVSNLVGWVYQEDKLSKLYRRSLGSSPLAKTSIMKISPTKD